MEIVGAKGPDHKEMMERLGDLCSASRVEHKQEDKGSEYYIVVKDGQVWKIYTEATARQIGYLKEVRRTE